MKAKRLAIILGPFACVLALSAYSHWVWFEPPRPSVDGELLTIKGLKPGEEIVVSRVVGRHDGRPRKYYTNRLDNKVLVSVYSATVSWESGAREYTVGSYLGQFPLTESAILGLDQTLAYFRRIRDDGARQHRAGEYLIEGYRNGDRIGVETLIGFDLTQDLDWIAESSVRVPEFDTEGAIAQLAMQYRMPPSKLGRFLTFEAIDREVQGLNDREAEGIEFGDDWPGVYRLEEWNQRVAPLRGSDQVCMEVMKTVARPTRWISGHPEYDWRVGVPVQGRPVALSTGSQELLSLLEFEPNVSKGTHRCYGLFNLLFLRNGEVVGGLHFAHGQYWAPITRKSQQVLNAWLAERGFPTPEVLEAEERGRSAEVRKWLFRSRTTEDDSRLVEPRKVPIDLPRPRILPPPRPRLPVEERDRVGRS